LPLRHPPIDRGCFMKEKEGGKSQKGGRKGKENLKGVGNDFSIKKKKEKEKRKEILNHGLRKEKEKVFRAKFSGAITFVRRKRKGKKERGSTMGKKKKGGGKKASKSTSLKSR